ncbi:hypothetical protein PLICRDRAFT_133287 [Plicaturopsis crispa FD-325 SS-3]|nr:hypothetical protein PLICRDRAFT_133287 [Plicaturopsis crispa FD-325 SS-3]
MASKPCVAFATSRTCPRGIKCPDNHIIPIRSETGCAITIPPAPKSSPFEKTKTRPESSQIGPNHIREFFERYPPFSYDPSSSIMQEFWRMCDFFHWDRQHPKRMEAQESLRIAMTEQFNSTYGTKEDEVTVWENLCRILGIVPVRKGLKACRKAVMDTHVNIVDLLEAPLTGKPIMIFSSEQKLSHYTRNTPGKKFPKEEAYAGGLLKHLLRQIDEPKRGIGYREGSRRR